MTIIEAKFPMKRIMTKKLDQLNMAVHEMSDEYEDSDNEFDS